MFVLGIDPGLTRCGYGLVEGSFQGVESFRAIRAGTIETDHELAVELRLGQILIELRTLLEETTPDAVVVERVFYQRNAKTAIPVAQPAAWPSRSPRRSMCRFDSSTPRRSSWRSPATGPRARPRSRQWWRLCGLAEIPKPADAADALALAITYFMVVRSEEKYALGSRA